MRAKEFLVEYKSEAAINAILTKYGEAITTKLSMDLKNQINTGIFGTEPDPKKLIDIIINADPTKNSIYVNWILQRYLKGNFRYLEDISKAHDLLAFYEKSKPKLEVNQRNIDNFKTFNEFYTFINELKKKNIDTDSNRSKEQQFEKELIEKGEARVYYNSPEIKIIIPKSEKASCYFGRNTRWCTAAQNNNMFSMYNKRGNLYILLFKKQNIRWQFQFKTMQFMDENDNELTADQAKSVGYLFPETFIDPNASEQVQLTAVKRNEDAIRYIKNPSEQVQLAAVNQNGYAIRFIENPSEQVQLTAVKRNGDAIGYIKNPSEQVQLAAVNQNGYAIRFIENPSEQVQLQAKKNRR